MGKDSKKGRHFSKEGAIMIGLIVLTPIFYVLSPPFVVKAMVLCGLSDAVIEKSFDEIYRPIFYLMTQEDVFINAPLEAYYTWSFDLLDP